MMYKLKLTENKNNYNITKEDVMKAISKKHEDIKKQGGMYE